MAPLLPVAVAFIIGILLQGVAGQLWWVVMLLLTAAVISLLLKRSYPAILALCAVAGYFVSWVHAPRAFPDELNGRESRWSAYITEHREYEGAQMVIVRVDSCEGVRCRFFLAKCLVPSLLPSLDETDRMEFSAAMEPIAATADLPDEQDYNALLRRMGVTASCIIEPDSITAIAPEGGILNDIRRLRRPLQRLIAYAPVAENTRSFLIATLTGDRTWLTADTRELFSTTGIAHILALSGMHVGILTMVLTLLFLPLTSLRGGRYGRIIATVVVLWCFAVLTGMSPSVVRAVIMATMFAICTMLQRVWSPLNALAAAALLILFFSPAQLYSLGFILTFLAVLSIIVYAPRLNPLGHRRPVLRSAAECVCVALAAMLGTGVVCACVFHVVPVYFLLTNVVVALLLPVLLGGGILLLALNIAGIRAIWLGWVIDMIMSGVESVARGVASLPGAVFSGVWVQEWIIVLYFVALVLFGLWLYRRRVVMLYAMFVILVAGVVIWSVKGDGNPDDEVYITRSSSETTMLVKESGRLYAYTTAPPGRIEEVISQASRRYDGYMMRRGIDAMTLLHDGMRTYRTARVGNAIVACGKSFVFVSHDSHVRDYAVRPDYAVVCRGFRGDICDAAGVIGADTILLSRDLALRRHDRYVRELTEAGIPHRTLRDAPYHTVDMR